MGYGEFMAKPIDQVAVLGAGVMGASIAAHLANAGIKVLLLDIPSKDAAPGDRRARNQLTAAGLERARKAQVRRPSSRPASKPWSRWATWRTTWTKAARCDLVVEAIIENLTIKRNLYTRLEALGGSAVITSNTSGLRMKRAARGSQRRTFAVASASPTSSTPPATSSWSRSWPGPTPPPRRWPGPRTCADGILGKGLVRAKDTPNFIANRIGTFALLRALDLAVREGYTVEEVDMVFGPATGRPRSAVFRTADLVGIDTLVHVARHCHAALVDDERREVFAVHPVLEELVRRKWLGGKSGQGFYKKQGDEILQLDLKTFEYVPLQKPRFPSIGATKGVDDVDERLRRMLGGATDDRAAALARTVIYETMAYSAARIPEIADDVSGGGPGHALGLRLGARPLRELGRPRGGGDGREDAGRQDPGSRLGEGAAQGRRDDLLPQGALGPNPAAPPHRRLRRGRQRSPGHRLDAVRAAGGEVERNPSASILDLGDGVFCLEFHAKMNAIDADIGTTAGQGGRSSRAAGRRPGHRQRRERGVLRRGEPVRPHGGDVPGPAQGQSSEMVRGFQDVCYRLRYARVPVVAAPFGLTLGGGAEVMLGCTAVRAFTELYVGLVEVGVGLIPAGGGCMEMAARVAARAPDDPTFDLLQLLRGPFEAIGLAKVATSAEEARDLGYLRPSDSTSMARETLIADAKQIALGLARAGYRPPPPRQHPGGGRLGGGHLEDRHPAPGPRPPGQRTRLPGGEQGGARPVRRRRLGRRPGERAATSSTSSARPSSRCVARRRRRPASSTCCRLANPSATEERVHHA